MEKLKVKIGRYTIEHTKKDDGSFVVMMTPGTLILTTASGNRVHNMADVYYENDKGYALRRFETFKTYARNEKAFDLWQRLNRLPLAVYLRYQKLIAKYHCGMWVRGVTISNGKAKLNFE